MEATWTGISIAVLAQALQPFGAPVDTGGARMVADGLRGGPVSGAVGERQYVQAAAGMVLVVDKASGAAAPPRAVAALYAAAPGQRGMRACAVHAAAPVSVLYDQSARRWVLGYLAGAGNWLCLATSAGPNAAGRYVARALALQPPATGAAQLALWGEALIVSYASGAQASRACALQTTAGFPVLRCRGVPHAGLSAAQLLPQASVAGAASATPALLLALDAPEAGAGGALLLWRYRPHDNTLSGPTAIPVAPYRLPCGACIGQPNGGAALPAHGGQLAPGAVFDGHALLANHTVLQGDGRIAIRWYEIRAPFDAPQLYQQGNHAPDAEQRWMGSIGIDRAGDIALAYAVSSGATASGIRYTGRVRSDPPGRLAQEETIVNGSGVQSTADGLAAPAGALALDPVDGCTFWYTQQYIQSSSAAAWQSRIASFQFRRCR